MSKESQQDCLLPQVSQTISKYGLLHPGQRVLAAVSGGMDSMAMLHALDALGYKVEVAHFDHQTRQGQSLDDAAFVRNICESRGITFHYGTEPVGETARNEVISFENYARQRRYAFLIEKAKETGITVVATGHHRYDQAETVLMGLLGLTSGFGPCGMAPAVMREQVKIIRPLLYCGRETILNWIQRYGFQWRDDSTNEQRLYVRNRIRLDLLPFLEQFHPDAAEHLARFAESVRSDAVCLDDYAAELLDRALRCDINVTGIIILDVSGFRAAPEAVRRHAVKVLTRRLGVNSTSEGCVRIERFITDSETGASADLGGGISLHRTRTEIHILRPEHMHRGQSLEPTVLNIPGITPVKGYEFQTRILEQEQGESKGFLEMASPFCQYFDWEALDKPLAIRSRRPGDRMTPFGMTDTRKIQDMMVDFGIAGYRRDTVPLLEMQDKIIWLVGCRRGAAAPLGAFTRKVLEIKCLPSTEKCT
jgi:tRNA(Ile)-lysidine synthase